MLRLSKSNIKCNIPLFYTYVCLILLVYTSGSMYNIVYRSFNGLAKIFTNIFLCIGVLRLGKKDFHQIILFLSGGVGLAFLTYMAGGSIKVYCTTSLRILGVFVFYLYCKKKNINLLKELDTFFFIIAVFYLIMWFLFDIGPFVDTGKSIIIDDLKFTNYFNIYYRWHDLRKVFGMRFNSCNGPFLEPGLYMIWLNYALIYELFFRKATSYIKAIILGLAVVSTTSTMGAILLCFVLGIYFLYRSKYYMRVVESLPVCVGVCAVLISIWIERKNSRIESLTGRLGDMYILLKGILEHPILGNGIGNLDTTNSFFLYVYDFGILGFALVAGWFFNIMKAKTDIMVKGVIMVWTVLSLCNEPIGTYNLFVLTAFCIYAYFKNNCPKIV